MTTTAEIKAGNAMISAMGLHSFFLRRQSACLQQWASLNFFTKSMMAWLGHMNNFLVVSFGSATAFYLTATRTNRSIEIGGLALTYTLLLPYFFAFLVDFVVNLRTDFAWAPHPAPTRV